MRYPKKNIPSLAVLACTFLLGACASVTSVKDVAGDRPGYMKQKFSPATLPAAIAKKLPADPWTSGFGPLTIVEEATFEAPNGRTEAWKATVTFTDAGNGLVQRMSEQSNNDIPFALNYSLTYRGLFDLRWQGVPLRNNVTDMLVEVKDVTRFDPLSQIDKKEFVIAYTSGTEAQIANMPSSQLSCRTIRSLMASEVHPKLPGPALELECQRVTNNSVQSRGKWLLLQQYGLAFSLQYIGTSGKTTYRILDVKL